MTNREERCLFHFCGLYQKHKKIFLLEQYGQSIKVCSTLNLVKSVILYHTSNCPKFDRLYFCLLNIFSDECDEFTGIA